MNKFSLVSAALLSHFSALFFVFVYNYNLYGSFGVALQAAPVDRCAINQARPPERDTERDPKIRSRSIGVPPCNADLTGCHRWSLRYGSAWIGLLGASDHKQIVYTMSMEAVF